MERGAKFSRGGGHEAAHEGGIQPDMGIDRAVIVVMVMVTTMITPPALKWCMSRCGSHGDRGGLVLRQFSIRRSR